MSEQMHTPEPWHYDATGRIWRRHPSELYENGGGVAGEHPLATVHLGYSNWENGFPLEANARRIVACVNACAGIGTEALEKTARLHLAVGHEFEHLAQQRDKLLAALKDVMPDGLEGLCDECNGNPSKCFAGCPYPIARNLIAEIEASK